MGKNLQENLISKIESYVYTQLKVKIKLSRIILDYYSSTYKYIVKQQILLNETVELYMMLLLRHRYLLHNLQRKIRIQKN